MYGLQLLPQNIGEVVGDYIALLKQFEQSVEFFQVNIVGIQPHEP